MFDERIRANHEATKGTKLWFDKDFVFVVSSWFDIESLTNQTIRLRMDISGRV
jgi:hypothetical protein